MPHIKQVIVYRKNYPDKNGNNRSLRTGKIVAQCSHASMAFLTRRIENKEDLTTVQKEWLQNSFVKICVYVETEEELLAIQQSAVNDNIECHLITDKGLTEFNGVPTNTCLALGPDKSEILDKITGHLKLM
jgi:PTH2 family peptidyl-tRNA hydrolase